MKRKMCCSLSNVTFVGMTLIQKRLKITRENVTEKIERIYIENASTIDYD